jgi:tetratricopeptide (TPR) repeat protein
VHAHMGHMEQARADMDRALELAHDKPHIFFQRALVRKRDGDLAGARDDYDRALALAPDYLEAQYNRAFVRKHLGDHAGALEDADNALRTAPEDPDAWIMKGNIHLLYGEFNDAIACFDRAINLHHDHAYALFNRGLAYHMNYQPLRGCEDLRRSADLGSPQALDALKYFCAF